MLVPGTKKEDFLEGQFAFPGDKEGGLPGGPICLSRGQRRRTSWRASLFLPGTKKEDFLEGRTKKEDFLEGQFAYPGDKEGGLPEGPVCFFRGQRRRTSWRASLLIPGTKKEDWLVQDLDFVKGWFESRTLKTNRLMCATSGADLSKTLCFRFKA